MARTMQTARKSTGGRAPREQLASLPPRRLSRSPPRVRKLTNHGDAPPFIQAAPVAIRGEPIYLTTATPQPPKPDLFDHLQVVACVLFITIVALAMIGPSTILTWAPTASAPIYTPLQQRGPLGWAWMLVKSTNDW